MNRESPDASSDRATQRFRHVPLFTIAGLAAAAYAASLRYGFVYDDVPQIVNNFRLTSWQYLPSYFTHHVWAQVSSSGTYYRPLFLLWLRINDALFGVGSAAPWHVTTVALHLAAIVLVYFLLRRTIESPLAAAVATLVFALHPGHVESVAWVSGCTEPLMTCALVGSLLCWLKRAQGFRWYAASLVLFVVALLVKETALLLPAMLFLYALAYERRTVVEALRTVLIFVGVAGLEWIARNRALHGGVPGDAHALPETVMTIPVALVFYVRHLVWPVRLSTFYDVFLVHEAHYPAWLASIGFVLVLVWIARSSREALIAVSWIVLPLLPALAGIRIFDTTDIVHDRYLYLSTIGLGMLLGLVFAKLPASGTRVFGVAAIPLAAAGAVALALLVGTVVEIQPWQSNLTLFARSVAVAPHSPAAFNHLAFEMYKRGDVPAAHRFYEQALSLDPHDWPGNFGLAVLDMRTGNLSEADQFFQRAIDLKPEVTNATYLLQGQVRLQAGHASDAERSVRRAIALWPSSTSQHLLLAQILLSQQRPEEAKVEFEKELQVDPNSAEAMEGLRSLAR